MINVIYNKKRKKIFCDNLEKRNVIENFLFSLNHWTDSELAAPEWSRSSEGIYMMLLDEEFNSLKENAELLDINIIIQEV